MATVHMVLQGKGGVGKSFIASMLAQYLHKKNGEFPLCIDTDPVNATFHGYKEFDTTKIEIMEGDEINSRGFDALVELLAKTTKDSVVDNGASSFVPLSSYLLNNQIFDLIKGFGHTVKIHTVVTGGQALIDTLSGLVQMTKQFPDNAEFIVWLNTFWGLIEHEGRSFENLKAYKDNKDKITAIINLPVLKKETHGLDLSNILQERITFDSAIENDSLPIMTRHRLKLIRDDIFNLLDEARI